LATAVLPFPHRYATVWPRSRNEPESAGLERDLVQHSGTVAETEKDSMNPDAEALREPPLLHDGRITDDGNAVRE
jgi:hypothetical protein